MNDTQESKPRANRLLLESAWTRYKVYSDNATSSQERFSALRLWIVSLNVLAVFFAIFRSQTISFLGKCSAGDDIFLCTIFGEAILPHQELIDNVTRTSLILLPVVITGLLAFSIKFDKGNTWILLRGSAESLKMEIYYYRAAMGEYSQDRDAVLARKIKLMSERLKGSVVHQTSLRPFESEIEPSSQKTRVFWKPGLIIKALHFILSSMSSVINRITHLLFGEELTPSTPSNLKIEKEDRFSDLTAEQYLVFRVEDQFDWYRRKTRKLDRQLLILQTLIYVFGGVGTFLAAISFEDWVAVTIAIIGALSNYLEFKRVETTLIGYNQAADALYDIRTWWFSQPEGKRKTRALFSLLVKNTEETIRSEHTSWLQDMQDRLAELYRQSDTVSNPQSNASDRNREENSVNLQSTSAITEGI
ncbi:MAG: DUF4231 domain-containing protein [Leptolyngbyaceae bacterium]|nr:DUF4231 domain-containing protein [Leptolyngbyaceae bacterium]